MERWSRYLPRCKHPKLGWSLLLGIGSVPPVNRTLLLASLILATAVPAGTSEESHAHVSSGSVLASCPATGSKATAVLSVELATSSAAPNAAAIQRVIDAAAQSGGAIVQLPAGRVDIESPIVLKDNVELKGASGGTVLKATSNFLQSQGPYGGHPLITTNGAANVTISSLTADHSGDSLAANSTEGRLNEYLIDVRRSTNVVVNGVLTKNPFTYSIAVVGSSRFCILNSSTTVATSGQYDQLDGIHVLDSHDGLVAGNNVDQGRGSDGDDGLAAHTIGSPVHDVTFEGNTVRGGPHGAGMQLALGNARIYNITVINNRFWGSPEGLHTGYYEGSAPVDNARIANNEFIDNSGPSINLYGALSHITVVDNQRCRSGEFKVGAGEGNRVGGNKATC